MDTGTAPLKLRLGAVSRRSRERVGLIVIHGAGETEAGWINDRLVPHLAGHPAVRSSIITARSMISLIADATRPNLRFKAFLRRVARRPAPISRLWK